MEENTVTNKDYMNYRDKFMRLGMYNVATTAAIILFAILLLFVPMFSINMIIATEWFSLFDEISLVFKGSFSAGSTMNIIGFVYMIALIVMGFVSIIKQILAMTNPDSYALKRYDDIKKRGEIRSHIKRYDMSGKSLIVGTVLSIVIFAVGIIFSTTMSGDKEKITSYFSICTGVNGLITFVILFLIAAVVLTVMASSIDGKIEFEIMKKEYDGAPAENSVAKPVEETANETAAANAEEIANADVKDVK